MEYQVRYINPEIKRSCYRGKLFLTEAAFEDHLLVWLISGETKTIRVDESFLFGAGSTFLIPRNQLAAIIRSLDKQPDTVLNNFNEPRKIEVAVFMKKTPCLICFSLNSVTWQVQACHF